MKSFLVGLAIVPFMSAVALAQPAQLSERQMDTVTAGWSLLETDVGNTSWTRVGVWVPTLTTCSSCYLNLTSQAFQVQSNFGPVPTFAE